ncbi:MAG: SirB2 family protein [Methylococcaceae bacterium]|nr:SirB2 family protein [Methylococcaceae bacterium]
MKHLHLLFVAAVIFSFLWRVYLAEKLPEKLTEKWIKILPHGLAAGLLLSGIALVFQGNWSDNYGWIVAKVLLMLVFIAAGLFTLREQGQRRWISFGVAMFSFVYIVKLAITKQIFFL